MAEKCGLFSYQYFGSISSFVDLVKYKNIVFSSQENFQKQSYHNRCVIAAANGILNLIIPIHHTGARSMDAVEISYEVDWKKNHLKSLASAYRRSPYFEFYEDYFEELYCQKPKLLKDFLLATSSLALDLLKLDVEIPTEQSKHQDFDDFRGKYHPKEREKYIMEPYIQVFSSKNSFLSDVCILDLLFNLGSESKSYLINQKFI